MPQLTSSHLVNHVRQAELVIINKYRSVTKGQKVSGIVSSVKSKNFVI